MIYNNIVSGTKDQNIQTQIAQALTHFLKLFYYKKLLQIDCNY